MPQRILKAVTTPTAKNTLVFYAGSFIQSVFRYLFHLILLRLLLPAEYGEFLSYLSLTYLLGIPMGTVATVVTKYVSVYQGKEDKVSINLFFYFLLKTLGPLSILISILLIAFSNPLAALFKAHPIAFVVLGISMLISLFQTILTSYITAFQKFITSSILSFVGVILTILFAIIFVRLNFGATGALLGQFLGTLISTVLIFLNIKEAIYPKIKIQKKPHFSLGGFTSFSFIYSLGTLSLISVDILVLRVFSDAHFSGLYSALSILGRMILFGLTPLIAITLPIASHRQTAIGTAKTVFLKLGTLIFVFGLIGAGIFSLFPSFIVQVLSGSEYLEIIPHLAVYSFSMVFFALSQFILSYLMAIGIPKANLFLLAAALIQPVIYYLFRSSFSLLVWSNFGLQLFLLIVLLAFYFSRKT